MAVIYAYCLFCNTVKCAEVALQLRKRFGFLAITPKIIQRKWVRGVAYEEKHDFLPGYVFVYTDAPIGDFHEILRLEHVLRVLGNRDAGSVLSGGDLAFARMLYDCDGTIGIMKTYQEGDRVKLARNMLGDFEGEIIRLDRGRGRAQIRYQFDGVVYKTWVGYEMIDGGGTDRAYAPEPKDEAPGREARRGV